MSSPLAAAILKRITKATRLIYFLYQVVGIVTSPAVALYLLYRGIRDARYFRGFPERFGFLPSSLDTTGAPAVWFHAVSVGEVLSTVELVRRMRSERPSWRYYVSTTTLAGRETADRKLRGIADAVFFAPFDYRSAVRRVLRKIRPLVLVVLETEIWPNLYRESKRAGASLVIVNGRISDRALPRYRRWSGFFRHVLAWPDRILAQSEEDRQRFQIAGAAPERVHVGGNLKYDFTPPAGIAPELERFLDRLQQKHIWIAASTMTDGVIDEEDAVMGALAGQPDVFLILAPRKPERFDVVAEKLERACIPFVRRSRGLDGHNAARVLLLDSIGELAALFERGDIVFMGGTLADRGGHNILEPAYFGKAVIAGPHMENFAAIAAEFEHAGALERIPDAASLGPAVSALIHDPGRRREIGDAARQLATSKRGVAERIAHRIIEAAADAIPNPRRTLAARMLLTPLSWIWRAANRWNATRPTRALKTPVISIGGLSMGGAGKSPLAAHLAKRLRERGRNPAILTRGYKRYSRGIVIAKRGERLAPGLTGDEAQIFLRRGDAHVGIGADRYQAGARMERDLAPGAFVLDDGFQHRRLARTHDIVLIDAQDPLAGGVFPLGRLREPFEALARASIVILTRVEPEQDTRGMERLISRYNSRAPVFRSRVVPVQWVGLEGPQRDVGSSKFDRAAAFCGLGSPAAFWRTLEQLGIGVVWRKTFRDHHRYTPQDLKRISQEAIKARAGVLLTTEKDAINMVRHSAELLSPLKLYWLRIDVEIENEKDLLKRIL